MIEEQVWSPAFARATAETLGVGELTEAHWRVIDFMRRDFAQKGETPSLRRISIHSGVQMKVLYRLFPKRPGRLAARIAGVPKPRSCL